MPIRLPLRLSTTMTPSMVLVKTTTKKKRSKPKPDKKAGRRKIKIEFIQDKSRWHITFCKRKAGELQTHIRASSFSHTYLQHYEKAYSSSRFIRHDYID
jgi:hypothetical protein